MTTLHRRLGAVVLVLMLALGASACSIGGGDYVSSIKWYGLFVEVKLKPSITKLLVLKYQTGYGCDRAPHSGLFTGSYNPGCVSEGIMIAGGTGQPREFYYAMTHNIFPMQPGSAAWAWGTLWSRDRAGIPSCYRFSQTMLDLPGTPATYHGWSDLDGECHD